MRTTQIDIAPYSYRIQKPRAGRTENHIFFKLAIGRVLVNLNIQCWTVNPRCFPFDKKIAEFPCGWANGTDISGILISNFWAYEVGLKSLENKDNWKIPLHLTISSRAHFLRARKSNSTWLILKILNIIGVCYVLYLTDHLKSLTSMLLQLIGHNKL